MFYYSSGKPLVESVFFNFYCSKCNEKIEYTSHNILSPNFAGGDTSSETANEEEDSFKCPKCNKLYSFTIGANICETYVTSYDLPEDTQVHIEDEHYYEHYLEAVESNTEFFETFRIQMEKNKKLSENNISNAELINTLDKLLFSNMITCLETYLSDALINTIFTNKIFVENFVEKFENYKKCSFKFNTIYKQMDNIEKKVKEDLLGLMYHNLEKIKAIYKITFNINFPDIGNLKKKVSIRHDLVHRNGKDKHGKEHTIDKPELNETYNLFFEFVKNIDEQLKTVKEKSFR